jgi:hypothetical protein
MVYYNRELAIDGVHGIWIPMAFVETYPDIADKHCIWVEARS